MVWASPTYLPTYIIVLLPLYTQGAIHTGSHRMAYIAMAYVHPCLVHEWVYALYIGLVISGSLNLLLLHDGLIGMPSHVVRVIKKRESMCSPLCVCVYALALC